MKFCFLIIKKGCDRYNEMDTDWNHLFVLVCLSEARVLGLSFVKRPPAKKRNNYKLLVDPEIKKGHKKVYRLNGKDEPGFPPCGDPKDPRTQKTVLGLAGSSIDYKMPRFKFDKFWVGEPPARDIFVIGLNESVRSSLFKEVCSAIGPVHAMKFHRHPKTKTFLGAATVSFEHSGMGKAAVLELDGKVIGGCYLRAELDDNGEHLKKYLEPVLKKCGLDATKKPPPKQLSGGKGSVSDTEDTKTRTSSTTESVPDTCETPDVDSTALPTTVSAATTPLTPSTAKNESLPNTNFPQLFQFSILNVETPGGSDGGFASPVFPCTPSSIDSGISIRTHNTILSPLGEGKPAKKSLLSGLKKMPLPPLPPEESAPPLPPSQDAEVPPPLPPSLPPQDPRKSLPDAAMGGGIENISSDEEEDTKTKPAPVPVPVSMSPSTASPPTQHHANHTFDPSLGLKSLLTNQNDSESMKSSFPAPYVGSTSPRPAYELEVEEISGDESPVMVYFEPLKVESISDDEGDVAAGGGATAGGDDMEISDNENDQDNVIEVNVDTAPVYQGAGPMMAPHPHMPYHDPLFLPHPAFFHPHHLPPPPGGFPLPHPHFMMFPPGSGPPSGGRSPPHPSSRSGGSGRRRNSPRGSSRHYDSLSSSSSTRSFIKDHDVPRPHNGYISNISRYPPSRSFSKSKVLRNFSSPKSKTESISQDVLFKAMEQLRLILLNDVHKKIVERSAYPVLDAYWEKREKEKLVTEEDEKEKASAPNRRMMPDAKAKPEVSTPPRGAGKEQAEGEKKEEEEEEEGTKPALQTPRKRLMNFKIPLVRGSQRRDQQHSIVATRRLFKDGQEESRPREEDEAVLSKKSERGGYYSDISSSEYFTSSESEEEEEAGSSQEEAESSQEGSDFSVEPPEPSSDSDSDFEKFLENRKKRKKSVEEVKAQPKKQQRKKRRPAKRKAPVERSPRQYRDKENLLDATEEEEEEEVVEIVKPPPPKARYKPRLTLEEQGVLEGFIGEPGLDKEDVQMFKLALGQLRGEEDSLVESLPWAHYPHMPPSLPPPTKKRRVSKSKYAIPEEDHLTGCARSEGYYKIDMREKVKYLPHHRLKNTSSTTTEPKKNVKSSGRVNRANQRKLASLYSAGDVSSDIAKYNQFKARKKLLKFSKSTIHNWGLFALESIPADEMVIEYVGQVVRQGVADEREKKYEAAGIGSSYLFRVDHDYIIDATKRGGLARFINHCCDPNCYAKVINFSTGKKIVIYSKRDIASGEEITYDYKFPIEDEKIPCLCGAPNCRGTLN